MFVLKLENITQSGLLGMMYEVMQNILVGHILT